MRIVLLAALVLGTPSIAYADAEPTPPLSGGRILGETMSGLIGAVGGTFLGGLGGFVACSDHDVEACLDWMIIGAFIGVGAGAGTGVYLVGVSGNQDGSLAASIAGGLAGSAVSLAYLVITDGDNDDELLALVAAPIAGSLIGFNLTRRYDKRVFVAPGPDRVTIGFAGTF